MNCSLEHFGNMFDLEHLVIFNLEHLDSVRVETFDVKFGTLDNVQFWNALMCDLEHFDYVKFRTTW